MNKLIDDTIFECEFCSKSIVLLSSSKSSILSTLSTSSNIQDKEYFLYFQNNNLSLFEGDDVGMRVLDEIRIGYCPMCGRELGGYVRIGIGLVSSGLERNI